MHGHDGRLSVVNENSGESRAASPGDGQPDLSMSRQEYGHVVPSHPYKGSGTAAHEHKGLVSSTSRQQHNYKGPFHPGESSGAAAHADQQPFSSMSREAHYHKFQAALQHNRECYAYIAERSVNRRTQIEKLFDLLDKQKMEEQDFRKAYLTDTIGLIHDLPIIFNGKKPTPDALPYCASVFQLGVELRKLKELINAKLGKRVQIALNLKKRFASSNSLSSGSQVLQENLGTGNDVSGRLSAKEIAVLCLTMRRPQQRLVRFKPSA